MRLIFDIDYDGCDIELFEYLLSMQNTDIAPLFAMNLRVFCRFLQSCFLKNKAIKLSPNL